jgi:hypothetical protein
MNRGGVTPTDGLDHALENNAVHCSYVPKSGIYTSRNNKANGTARTGKTATILCTVNAIANPIAITNTGDKMTLNIAGTLSSKDM